MKDQNDIYGMTRRRFKNGNSMTLLNLKAKQKYNKSSYSQLHARTSVGITAEIIVSSVENQKGAIAVQCLWQ